MALKFPFSDAPGKNQLVDIHDDVKWLRSPLPLSLDHINCYLLRDGDGWAIVDTGMNVEVTRNHWLDIVETHLKGAPITKVFVTHQHPDHVGLAGWLCRTFEASLFMTETEYLCSRVYTTNSQSDPFWETDEYFESTNMSKDTRAGLRKSNSFNDSVSAMPPCFHRIKDLQSIRVGNYDWQAITTRGHAPEHLSLYCAELDLLISGDQVLPRITSNVSITSINPHDSPLTDWYLAHEKVESLVPDTVTVLPAHELPFIGLHERLKAVIEHHDERVEKLFELCETGQDAQALTTQLFERELDHFQNYLAVGECLAHLNMMIEQGRITRSLKGKVYLYQQSRQESSLN